MTSTFDREKSDLQRELLDACSEPHLMVHDLPAACRSMKSQLYENGLTMMHEMQQVCRKRFFVFLVCLTLSCLRATTRLLCPLVSLVEFVIVTLQAQEILFQRIKFLEDQVARPSC